MTQRAKAADQSTIIQSGQNTQVGYSADDMKKIIDTLGDQIPKLAAVASAVVEARLQTFEEKILQRFADAQTADAKAFASPDFQFSVGQAQTTFCRFGEDVNVDVLVDLLAQKSKQNRRSRLSLCLGQAIEKIAILTENEIAALAVNHLMTSTRFLLVNSVSSLGKLLLDFMPALLEGVSDNLDSYGYLEANGVASVTLLPGKDLIDLLRLSYPGVLSLGHETDRLKELFGEDCESLKPDLIIPCINNPQKWQANAVSLDDLKVKFEERNPKVSFDTLKVLMEPSSLMNRGQALAALKPYYPDVDKLFEIWDNTPVKRLKLTPVGTAIAHARIQQVFKHPSDLATWIS